MSGLIELCNSVAEASRTARSGSNKRRAARALASSPRIRLLTMMLSGLAGILIAVPVTASNALSSAMITTVSPARYRLSSDIAVRTRTASGSAFSVIWRMAVTLSVESSAANWRTRPGSSAACDARLPRQSKKAINVLVMKGPSAIGAVQRQGTGQVGDPEYDELRRGLANCRIWGIFPVDRRNVP